MLYLSPLTRPFGMKPTVDTSSPLIRLECSVEVTDEDMQMVRDFLLQWGAPEYIKGHFENLVEMHAKEAARVEELENEVEEKRGACVERDELKEQVDDLTAELDQLYTDQTGALETVKYWLLDVLVHKRPMQKPPRQILRLVEEAL